MKGSGLGAHPSSEVGNQAKLRHRHTRRHEIEEILLALAHAHRRKL